MIEQVIGNPKFRLIRYLFAGVVVSLGYTVTVIGLVDWLDIVNAEIANVISLILWTMISYVVHREFTFQFDGSHGNSIARFIFVFIVKLIASVGVIAMVTRSSEHSYLIGVTLNWVVLPLVSYMALRLWVFAVPASGDATAVPQ
jgi:putative flippase GtrA